MATLLQLSVPAGFTLFTQFGDERFLIPSVLERGPTPGKAWVERKIVRQKVLIRGFLPLYLFVTGNSIEGGGSLHRQRMDKDSIYLCQEVEK